MPGPPPPPGYAFVRVLGRGGMGEVVEVLHEASGARRALKRLDATLSEDARLRFAREARTVGSLEHPHIVRVHAADLEAPLPYFVQELVTGGTLADRVVSGGTPPAEARRLMQQVAGAVAHAHTRGVLHRDLKPANVLLTEDGQAKVSDFGLALPLEASGTRLTQTGTVLGTPAYMAPEQALDASRVDARADVYALGALLYALLTGVPPLETKGRSLFALLDALQREVPAPPSKLVAGVPADLEALCLRALAKDPEQRVQSAEEFLAALVDPAATARSPARGSRIGLALVGVVLVGAVLLGLQIVPPTPPAPAPGTPPLPSTPSPPRVRQSPSPQPDSPSVLTEPVELETSGQWSLAGAFTERGLVTVGDALRLKTWSPSGRLLDEGLQLTGEAGNDRLLVGLPGDRVWLGGIGLQLREVGPEGVRELPARDATALAAAGDLAAVGAGSRLFLFDVGGTLRREVDLAPGEASWSVRDLAVGADEVLVLLRRGEQESKLVAVALSVDDSPRHQEPWSHATATCLALDPNDPQRVLLGTALGQVESWRREGGTQSFVTTLPVDGEFCTDPQLGTTPPLQRLIVDPETRTLLGITGSGIRRQENLGSLLVWRLTSTGSIEPSFLRGFECPTKLRTLTLDPDRRLAFVGGKGFGKLYPLDLLTRAR